MKWWALGHLFTREPDRISMEPLDHEDDARWFQYRLPVHQQRTADDMTSRVVQFPRKEAR